MKKDAETPLCGLHSEFVTPESDGQLSTYMCNHSLGLQHRDVAGAVGSFITKWGTLGVSGHWTGPDAWFDYESSLRAPLAKIIGCDPSEVNVMNTLTANIHILLPMFYRALALPTDGTAPRTRILMTEDEFPSDAVAIRSVIAVVLGITESEAEKHIVTAPSTTEGLMAAISEHGSNIATFWVSAVAYRSGTLLDVKRLVDAAHAAGAFALVDLAHASGSVPLRLSEWGVDAAVFCTYKHLCAGPGNTGGIFLHKRHHPAVEAGGEVRSDGGPDGKLPVLAAAGNAVAYRGWWSATAATRFGCEENFVPATGAAALAVSNPCVISLISMRPAIDLIAKVGVEAIHAHSQRLADTILAALRDGLIPEGVLEYAGPEDPAFRGGHLLMRVLRSPKDAEINSNDAASSASGPAGALKAALIKKGVILDERKPDYIRVGISGLYNRHVDMSRFISALREIYA